MKPKKKFLILKVTPEQKLLIHQAAYKAAAGAVSVEQATYNISEWCRRTLLKAAKKELNREVKL